MFQRIYLKFILTAALMGLALYLLYPFTDQLFIDYARSHVTTKAPDFQKLVDRANERVKTGKSKTPFMALKEIAREDKIDLSQYFPQLRLERSLHNLEKRNGILLDYLLKQSKGRLQLGLDLHGGIAFTLETASGGGEDTAQAQMRKEKLDKAVEIIGTRINSLGVSEPLIRAVGDNRSRVWRNRRRPNPFRRVTS